MPDPVFQGLSNVYTDGGSSSGTTATVTFPTIVAGELVVVWVQRDDYATITGVTLGTQDMSELKRVDSDSGAPNQFQGGLWGCIADSGGTSVVATATWSSSDNWRSMAGGRWNNVASATPLTSACNSSTCVGRSGASTDRTFQSITTGVRALIMTWATDWDFYSTHTASSGYTKRLDNAIAGGGSSTTIFSLDKVVDAGTYGGTEVVSTATSDQWFGAILAFEPAAASRKPSMTLLGAG